jgi:hypothetical protein
MTAHSPHFLESLFDAAHAFKPAADVAWSIGWLSSRISNPPVMRVQPQAQRESCESQLELNDHHATLEALAQ